MTTPDDHVPIGFRVTAHGTLESMTASEVHASIKRALADALRQLRPACDNATRPQKANKAEADLRRVNEQLLKRISELERPAPEWMPLKAAAFKCGLEYEYLRKKAARGQVEARRDGGRWLVNIIGLKLRIANGLLI